MAQNGSKPVVVSVQATEETNTTGLEFTARYFDALQAKPDAWPLDRFYNKTSRHVHLRFGKRPEQALGIDQTKSLIARMKFDQCEFSIDSIYARQPWPTRYTVFAVGQLSHAGRVTTRKFTQTTVFVKFPPSKSTTARQYLILKTVFKFVDRVNDDVFFDAVNDLKKEGPTDVPRESLGKSTPSEKQAAIAVHIPPVPGDKRSSKKDSTSEIAVAGTRCQTTVVPKNTRSMEPIKDESSNKLILTPIEKSTTPRKLSKNMKKKIKQLNESAQRAEHVMSGAKLPEKRPEKTKTKYIKLCEITEGNQISTILTGDEWQTQMKRKKNPRTTETARGQSVKVEHPVKAKETSKGYVPMD